MSYQLEQLRTVAAICQENGWPLHRVQHAIRRMSLPPAARVSNCRLFAPEQVVLIAAALSRRPGRPRGPAGSTTPVSPTRSDFPAATAH